MSLFQQSVLNHTIQDESKVALRWAAYQNYLAKIDYISSVKEEKYQEGFLKDVFESCLGYTLDSTNPDAFNLEREKKNETDGKKADGVIYLNGEVVGVIELKAQDTKNLDKVETQAFDYHSAHSNSKYIIISNFDELRFYVDKKTAYEKFSLFHLTYEQFKILHLLLSYESIKEGIPLKLKEKSASFEQEISKKLYKDFSQFRMHLFENIAKNNDLEKSLLLRLTQKLCDRVIFILFAEDRGLLKPNTIREIREEFQNQKFTSYALYDMYKFYFHAINTGNEKLSIPKYNGGLFETDEVLDSLVIDDVYLDMKAQKLSDYDFMSDVSVNILGHIFEQSLTDLEEINASLNDEAFDKSKTKRKKDGVFYTPEYITKYIVENTLGKLCQAKRSELGLDEVVAPKNPKNPTKNEQQTKEHLEAYRNWLLSLKILDPACGSGAFLNQALNFLIHEHENLQRELVVMGDITAYYEIEKSILEHNLYGVDINEDAVEIAKLSLWLRTASKGRELTTLADKIVCANSLLEMPFEEGTFDVVIGNPPYVRVQGLKSNYENESKLYEEKYVSATGKYDLYALFLEMSFKMIKNSGKLSYILPHKFLVANFGKGIRAYLVENRAVESLLHFGSEMVFEDASAYTCIVTLSRDNEELKFKHISPSNIFDEFQFDSTTYEKLDDKVWNLTSQNIEYILNKINQMPLKVKDIFRGVYQGIVSGDNKAFYLKNCIEDGNYIVGESELFDQKVKVEKELVKKILNGKTIKQYEIEYDNLYIIYPYKKIDTRTVLIDEEELKISYSLAYDYLTKIYDRLSTRGSKNMQYPSWYSLWNYRNIDNQKTQKILTPDVCYKSNMWLDSAGEYFYNDTTYALILKDNKEDYRYYLGVLNSSLMWFYLSQTSAELRGGYFRFKTKYIEPFSFPDISKESKQPFIDLADKILTSKEKIKTYNKHIETLNAVEKIEIKEEIEKLEKIIEESTTKIDQMVYKLYGLTDDEIRIVEGVK